MLKITRTKTHKIFSFLGISLKVKMKYKFRYSKKYLSYIFSQIKPNKKNYLYLDWPFGGYVFEEMSKANYQDINLIKFSLFELFVFDDRTMLRSFCQHNSKLVKNFIKEFFETKNISGFLITCDWLDIHQDFVEYFKAISIKTICIIHEGVFQDRQEYYAHSVPLCDKTLVWGELLKSIFMERGYDENKLKIVGSIKLNSYRNFTPQLERAKFFEKLKLDPNKKTILYCCQLCDAQWGDQYYALEKQVEAINSLVDIAKKNDYNLIVRNAPAFPSMILSKEFSDKLESYSFVSVDGKDVNNTDKSLYITKPSDCIFYSDITVGMNTTMQLEASMLNKPAIVVKFFDFDAKWHDELGLPLCLNSEELEKCVTENISRCECLISDDKKEKFYSDYGFSQDPSYLPLVNIEKELN